MPTEILILGRLLRGPRHGYEVKQAIERSLGGLVRMTNSQIYPTLKALEEMGAVVRAIEPQAGRPERHTYAITAVGREILHDLVAELSEADVRRDTEFYVRVPYFALLAPEERLRLLHTRRMALLGRRDGVAGWRRGGAPNSPDFLAELGALRVEMLDVELRWLDRWITTAQAAADTRGLE